MKLFLIAGERSGDAHGAQLVRALKERAPEIQLGGLGGAEMEEEIGDTLDNWTEAAGVVGLWEVLKNYPYFKRKFDATLARIRTEKPDAVIFIDYPGFNLRLARALATENDAARRIYYISPQVWAWNRRRIPGMASVLHRMLCIFPFEVPLYEASGLPTECVGHPLADEYPTATPDSEREEHLIGLFPGSRAREVEKHYPVMLAAAKQLSAKHPHLKFVASAVTEARADQMRAISADFCPIEVGTFRLLIKRCWAGAIASGTATLEAALAGMPYCLVYKVAPLTYAVGKAVIKVDHLGIVNVLAGKEIVPELLQTDLTPEKLTTALEALLQPARRKEMSSALQETLKKLGGGNAHHRAATAILHELKDKC